MLLEQTFTGWILGAECRTSMKAEEDNECRKLKLETSESHRLGCLPKKRVQVAGQKIAHKWKRNKEHVGCDVMGVMVNLAEAAEVTCGLGYWLKSYWVVLRGAFNEEMLSYQDKNLHLFNILIRTLSV
ncbi:hypothetical protein ACFX19_040790 [Malus domestica]